MPLALALALQLATASATPGPTCPATPTPLAIPLDGWKPGAQLVAGTSDTQIPQLTLGARAEVTLADTAAVRYVVPPAKPATAGSRGGMVAFLVTRGGSYRVALGTAAWIDVIGGTKSGTGTAIESTAHDRGAPCTGIRKLVDFKLTPGPYVLQVSGSAVEATGVLVTPLP